MKQVLWYLIAGTRGGLTRAQIIEAIMKKPLNANQLSKKLKLDYKTVQHHLNVLEKNKVLSSAGSYGAVYFLSPWMEENMKVFNDIKKSGKDSG